MGQCKARLQQVILQTSKAELSGVFRESSEFSSTYENTGKVKEDFELGSVILYNLRRKYAGKRENYDARIVEDILCNDNTHAVTMFKDYLIFDNINEFMQRFFLMWEARNRLDKAFDFYCKHSRVFPNYAILKARKYMIENVIKKMRLINSQDKEKSRVMLKQDHVFTTQFMDEINKFSESSSTQLKSYIKSQAKEVNDMSFKELLDKFIQKDSRSLIDVNAISKEFEISGASEVNLVIKKNTKLVSNQSLTKDMGWNRRTLHKVSSNESTSRRSYNTSQNGNRKSIVSTASVTSKETLLPNKESNKAKTVSKGITSGKQTPLQNARKFTSAVKKNSPRVPLKLAKSEKSIKETSSDTKVKGLSTDAKSNKTLRKVPSSKALLDNYASVFSIRQQNNLIRGAVQGAEKVPSSSRLSSAKPRINPQIRSDRKGEAENDGVDEVKVKKAGGKNSKKFRSEYLNALSSRTKPRIDTREKKKPVNSKPESMIRLQQPIVLGSVLYSTNTKTANKDNKKRSHQQDAVHSKIEGSVSRNAKKGNMEKCARTYC
eukprot:TRINITY_DN6751_c0_g3_i1.p1 TRINITY_DN6751_c0_g3~~TRINITY_DN6751_c0_g3_i1.p1  ORF type:complete len:547 (-),score=84.82 TRINITY_DN6751_c0_g3_i1:101-1741(-)